MPSAFSSNNSNSPIVFSINAIEHLYLVVITISIMLQDFAQHHLVNPSLIISNKNIKSLRVALTSMISWLIFPEFVQHMTEWVSVEVRHYAAHAGGPPLEHPPPTPCACLHHEQEERHNHSDHRNPRQRHCHQILLDLVCSVAATRSGLFVHRRRGKQGPGLGSRERRGPRASIITHHARVAPVASALQFQSRWATTPVRRCSLLPTCYSETRMESPRTIHVPRLHLRTQI